MRSLTGHEAAADQRHDRGDHECRASPRDSGVRGVSARSVRNDECTGATRDRDPCCKPSPHSDSPLKPGRSHTFIVALRGGLWLRCRFRSGTSHSVLCG